MLWVVGLVCLLSLHYVGLAGVRTGRSPQKWWKTGRKKGISCYRRAASGWTVVLGAREVVPVPMTDKELN